MAFRLDNLVRENVKKLVPYSSARGEFTGDARVYLDANENSFGSPLPENYNRYPDPLQTRIKQRVAESNDVQPTEIFVGNGSDEAIDLLLSIFCRPQIDNVVICPPTYGMYEVAAGINDIAVLRASLTSTFALDVDAVFNVANENTKVIFLCSPNNPTGNLMAREAILNIASDFNGIIIVDEAYIHFSGERSLTSEINNYPNLVVLQTFSKAWGLAGLRVGVAFADAEIIALFNKIKPPYNVSQVVQEMVLEAFDNRQGMIDTIAEIVRERKSLATKLAALSCVARVYPSDANFLLISLADANEVYQVLLHKKIVVRNRSNVELCEGCLRITVGTAEENQALLKALEQYEKSLIY